LLFSISLQPTTRPEYRRGLTDDARRLLLIAKHHELQEIVDQAKKDAQSTRARPRKTGSLPQRRVQQVCWVQDG
jgi:hypothetical protein